MKRLVILIWTICIVRCSAQTQLHTALVHCQKWSVHELVIGNCSLKMNPRCEYIETPDKCQRKIACNLTGTRSDVSFLRPSNSSVLHERANYEWGFYFISLCADLCTLIKESAPWPGSDLWLNDTSFDVEISNSQGPQRVIENIRIDNEEYAVHILEYFSTFPDNFITAKTTLRGCNESITNIDTAEPYNMSDYWCTFGLGTVVHRPSSCELSKYLLRRGVCTGLYVSMCTRTVMCDVSAIAHYLSYSWNEHNACGFSCWMVNTTVGSSVEKHDFKIGTYDPAEAKWVYTKVYGVDKDHFSQIMNVHLNDKLLNPRGNVSLTVCPSNNNLCGMNSDLTYWKIRQMYGQLSTVNDVNRPDCISHDNRDTINTLGEQCVMHVECFNDEYWTGTYILKQMIWMYQKSIQWTHFDMHKSRAETELCLQFNDNDTCHPVGIAPLNETFLPYWSIYKQHRYANYIRLTIIIGSCVRLPNGTAKIVNQPPPIPEEETDPLAGFPSYNFPNGSVHCDSWIFQQWVDHHQACSAARNPRCGRIYRASAPCETRFYCDIAHSPGDVFWLQAHPNGTDEFISTLCTDMCTLIRESMPVPADDRWKNGTTFTVKLRDEFRRKTKEINGIKLNDENYARQVLDFFQPSQERILTSINVLTELEGCRRRDVDTERHYCYGMEDRSNECFTRTMIPVCERTHSPRSDHCTETIECNTTTIANSSAWSEDDVCGFLCWIANATLLQLQPYKVSNHNTNFDIRMGYLDDDEDKMKYHEVYDVERKKVLSLLFKYFFTMLQNYRTGRISLSVVSRYCSEDYTDSCSNVKFNQLYGQLSMSDDFFWPGCSYFEDLRYYGDCSMFIQCTSAHNLSTTEFCKRMIWMHQKSVQWSTLDVKSSTAQTEMKLQFDGQSINIPPIPLNEIYEMFTVIMQIRGRRARSIRVITTIHDCLPHSNGAARVIDTAPYICQDKRNFLYRATNISDFVPEVRLCNIRASDTDQCKRTVECRRKSPYNHFLCDWLMWMMAQSLYWPSVQVMNTWKEEALVNLTIKIDTNGEWNYDGGTELSPVQIAGAMTYFENFVHRKWFNGIILESTILQCDEYINGSRSIPFSLIGWCDLEAAMIAENGTDKPPPMQNCTEVIHNPICQVATCCQKTFRCFVEDKYTDGLNQLCRITKWLYQSATYWNESVAQTQRFSIDHALYAFHLTSIDLRTRVPKLLLSVRTSRERGFTQVAKAMMLHGRLDMDFYLTSRLIDCSLYYNNNAIDL